MENIHNTVRPALVVGMVFFALIAGCKAVGEKKSPTLQPSEPPVAVPDKAASAGGVRQASYEEPINSVLRPTADSSAAATVSGGGSVNIKVSDPEKAAAPVGAMPSGTPPMSSPLTLPSPTSSTTPPAPAAASSTLSDASDASVRILPPPGGEVPVTLHVDDIDIRKALEMISRQANASIVVSPGVTGKVTVDFQNMPLNKALDAITRINNAEVQKRDGILYISTVTEARKIEARNLPVRIYHLQYVRAADMLIMVKPLLSTEGGAKTGVSPESKVGLTSTTPSVAQTGSIGSTSDIKAGGNDNAGGEFLIITDYEEVLKRVDAAITEMDVQPIQVMIEAVIVQVKLSKNMELGASFGIVDSSGKALGVIGDGALINASTGFSPATVVTSAGKVVGGFAGDTYGLKYGFIGSNVTGYIQALEGAGETKVLAAPRLWVLNKQSAQVHLGKMLGYATTTVTTTGNTQDVKYMSVGTQLRIRPFVSDDGMIRMEVHPERSSGAVDSNGIPQTAVSQVTSNVLVRDGQTMVIGGLIDNDTEQSWTGLPFLSRIPWLGYLFRHTTDTTDKVELVVIITPRICPRSCLATYNGVGTATTLGLTKRVSQNPIAEKRDGKNLFELLQEQTAGYPCGQGPITKPPESRCRKKITEQPCPQQQSTEQPCPPQQSTVPPCPQQPAVPSSQQLPMEPPVNEAPVK